jgi:signal transduction histidine kinase
MKWYNSVKVKLLGFFLGISIVFLLSIIVTFFFIRENELEKNATAASSLATSFVLNHIKTIQTKAEEITLTLASVAEQKLENNDTKNDDLVLSVLDADKQNSIELVSGGIWLEPYAVKNIKDPLLFYNRDSKGKLKAIDSTLVNNYRSMEFYKISRKMKSGEVKWTAVYTDPVTGIEMITVVSPIFSNNIFIGTASIDLDLKQKDKKFWDNLESNHMYLIMLDKNGNFISRSSSLDTLIDTQNIHNIKNEQLKNIVSRTRPLLTDNIEHTDTNENDFLHKVYFLKDDPVFSQESVLSVYHFQDTHWNIILGILKSEVMAQSNETFYRVLTVIIILTLLATILGYIVLQKLFVSPIESINKQLKRNMNKNTAPYNLLESNDEGEIGLLVENLNNRTTALIDAQDREEKEIIKSMKSEKMLLQQSKMAAMGEMMDAVAHQWKQPLNALSMYSEIIKNDFEDGSVDQTYIDQFRDDIQVQIDHMVNTLDEFRTFFRPNKENEMFSLLSIVHSVLFLIKDDLLKNRITNSIEQKDHIDIDGSANEFKHLILNIINNAKDAFNENNIENREITISLINDEKGKRMEIADNAGGIPENIIADIFKADVTSKEEGKGTGIGLYMSTQIASKHNALLSVKNQNGGACFTIAFDATLTT